MHIRSSRTGSSIFSIHMVPAGTYIGIQYLRITDLQYLYNDLVITAVAKKYVIPR